jgi:hypothetical protein
LHANELSHEEQRELYRDGFVVVREAVPRQLTFKARGAINMQIAKEGVRSPYHDLSGRATLPDLVNESPLGEIMRRAMGPLVQVSSPYWNGLPGRMFSRHLSHFEVHGDAGLAGHPSARPGHAHRRCVGSVWCALERHHRRRTGAVV